jgi:hypothetical protein
MKTSYQIRWDTERILNEARKRTAELMSDNTKRVQSMLEDLMKEAGWSESEFVDALCTDVIQRKSVRPPGPGLAKVDATEAGDRKKRTG